MATLDYWAEAPLSRFQSTLFAPTLDDMIGEDSQVRLFDEVLAGIDWSEWEAEYDGNRGQPPIQPRWVASVILYALCHGLRSSRKLEYQCRWNVEFMWLVEGRVIDHTTIAKFRTRFKKPLKGLFRQVCKIAMSVGLIRLGEVAFDGTRVRANNSRYETLTAKTIEEKLKALEVLFDKMLAEAEVVDQQETLEGMQDSPTRLPPELADLKARRERLKQSLAEASAADLARQRKGTDPEKNAAQIPTTDPESRVLPNKEGGYAPNYTPTATTDGHRGFIVDADVLNEVNETPAFVPSLERVEEMLGERPQKALTDAGNNSGAVLEGLEQRGIDGYAPVESNQPQPGNPALRDDPTQPVPEDQWDRLPRSGRKHLAKSCFIYDAEQDVYYCPQGHAMPYEKMKPDERNGERITLRVYRNAHCEGCPLAKACLDPKAQHGRTITRDPYEGARERMAAKMTAEPARQIYNRRPHIAETPFALLKSVMDMRRFLLRSLEKVKTEWTWAVTAFNVGKLVRELGRLRAEFEKLIAATEG
jgi:transposase